MVKDAENQKERDDEIREKINKLRGEILEPLTSNEELRKLEYNRLSTGQEDVAASGGKKAFQRRWWKFTKEQDGKVPLIERWFYGRMAGTGQFLSLGLAISLGPSWGATVITLPMIEFTAGYVPSPMTMK